MTPKQDQNSLRQLRNSITLCLTSSTREMCDFQSFGSLAPTGLAVIKLWLFFLRLTLLITKGFMQESSYLFVFSEFFSSLLQFWLKSHSFTYYPLRCILPYLTPLLKCKLEFRGLHNSHKLHAFISHNVTDENVCCRVQKYIGSPLAMYTKICEYLRRKICRSVALTDLEWSASTYSPFSKKYFTFLLLWTWPFLEKLLRHLFCCIATKYLALFYC